VRDHRDAELVHEMRIWCESHLAYSQSIVFGISRGLCSRLLFSRSPVDRSSEGDHQSTCQIKVIWASGIVQSDITSKCTFYFSYESSPKYSSEIPSPVLSAIGVAKHVLGSYHILIARVLIVPAENSHGMWDIEPSGGYRAHEASDHRLVSGQIAGFFVGLSLLKVRCHW
jgi:hypothetical protein